jgi:hypothetical protein
VVFCGNGENAEILRGKLSEYSEEGIAEDEEVN